MPVGISKPIHPEGWGEMTSEKIRARCLSAAPSNALVRHPIVRRIYLVYFVLSTLLILVPLWTLLYIPRSNRPRPSWPLKRCLRVRWSRRLCAVVARCEIDYLGRDLSVDLDPMSLQYSHPVTLEPAPSSWLVGHPKVMLEEMHASSGRWHPHFVHRIKRTRSGVWGRWNEPKPEHKFGFSPVSAFWYTGRKADPAEGPKPREPGQPVMLLFHGGGYLCGTAAETDLTSSIAKSMCVHTPVHHVLSVDYRLAPNAPWPLPLCDAISAYHHLVHVEGIDERDLLVAGDSAGGHLALALTRWVRDEGAALGLRGPRGLVALSPWCDMGFTNLWGPEAFTYNASSDTIDNTFGPFAASLLLRALPPQIMHESVYLSPASLLIPTAVTGRESLAGFPPMFVVYGGAERLGVEINVLWSRLQLARKLEPQRAVSDAIMASPDAVHDFMIFPWFAQEAADVYEQLDEWLRNLLSEADSDDDEVDELAVDSAALEDLPTSPEWMRALRRRESRRYEMASLKSGKSPVMVAHQDTPVIMVGDMQAEGMSLIDMPELDLDALALPSAAELITPITSQFELGEWDWDEGPGPNSWYELGEGESDSDDEPRKER